MTTRFTTTLGELLATVNVVTFDGDCGVVGLEESELVEIDLIAGMVRPPTKADVMPAA